jgi:dolichyl-phosphate-mannose--protein O-mannosyl transferase
MSTLARQADARDAERAGSPPTETRAARPLALAAACGLVFVGSLALFAWGLDAARDIYFDETWYVPTAREFLKSGVVLHPEHPPLAKLLIAAGLRMFGDNPIGWRAMSALFGALTVTAVTIWSFALLRDAGQALWAGAVTLADSVVYVQARIAMLDIFLMAFCAFGLAFFTLSLKEKRSERRSFGFAVAAGASLGLAGACKLSGFFLLAGFIAARLLIGLLKLWRVRFEDARESDFFGPDAWAGLTPAKTVLAFVVAPFLAYFLAHIPQLIQDGSPLAFFGEQRRMIEIMTGTSATHPYSSLWWEWPAMARPIWYLFHVEGGEAATWGAQNPAQAIVALANPLVLYAGEAAILLMTWRWIARRDVDAMIVAIAFFFQYLPWAANPKGLEFFYYYFPPLLCAGPALALAFFRGGGRVRNAAALAFLAAAGLTFVFFLPVLSAQFPVDPDAFGLRVWFSSWR